MKSFYFLAVFLALGLANRIHFLYLRGRLLAFFLPQSLLLSVCSQHLLLIRIWRGCLSPVCSVLYRANPLHPARDSGETLPTTSASAFFPPSICTSYRLASWFLYAGLCAWRTAHSSEWIKPRVGSRLCHLEGLTFSYILFCVLPN